MLINKSCPKNFKLNYLKSLIVKQKHIVFCGYNVFPLGFAQTQRVLLIAKGLEKQDCKITVLCTYGTYNKHKTNVKAKGQFESIKYIYCSGLSYRPDSFFLRNFRKIIGFIYEFFLLLKYRISGDLNYIFISTNFFKNVLYYSLISKVLFVDSAIDNTEFWSASKKKYFGIGPKLYDYLSPLLFKKVICISDYLYNHTLKVKNISDVLKIPALVDFSKFNISQNVTQEKEKAILFCGSITYYPVIDFIISSFEIANLYSIKLIIVASNGRDHDYERLNQRIRKSSKANLIVLKSNLIYYELVDLYLTSQALLIPLRPNTQDIARFPHKLGEYTASKGIIITTNFGEIPNYFKDGKNALVVEKYDILNFAKKIEYAINNYDLLTSLKEEAYKTGLRNFDYNINGQKVYNFLFSSTMKSTKK